MLEGLSGDRMLLGLLIGIIFLIFLVLKTKVQSFLALIVCTVVVGVIGGMPLNTITLADGRSFGILNSISTGFGNTLASIGIIIGFGVMMGQIFEATGAAKRMAYTFLKLFGKKREEEAMALTGYFVSIPIFCDSGFVILSPIAKAISKVVRKSVIGLGAALASGLVITHTLVPPTPGPLGVCGIFGIDVGKFILIALILAIPITIACLLYCKLYLGKKIFRIPNENGEIVDVPYQSPIDKILNLDLTGVPGTLESFAPLVVPIILILINTISTAMGATQGAMAYLIFLGQPIIAVGIGVLISIFTLARRLDRDTALKEMEKGMQSAGIIMLVTGGGGALGQIIKDSGLGTYMATNMSEVGLPIIILPLLIATVMRFIQGSGTVAMTTAASISAPIIIAGGVDPILGALACCVGSFFFSYFNDSFFWVVNRLLGVSNVKEQILVWSVPTTIAWFVGSLEVLVLSMFL